MVKIAVIGGGLSGTLVAMKVLQRFQQDAEVFLFEKKPLQIFRGVAYSSALKFQPLNVRASQMNLWQNKPGHFYQWLEQAWPKYFNEKPLAADFIRRDVFGDYLHESFTKSVSELKSSEKLKIIFDEVLHIDQQENKFKVATDSETVTVDFTVLALGNFLPGDLPIKNNAFYQSDLYQSNPWSLAWMNALNTNDDVLFLGSGLTTVDQVINLLKQDHHGKIKIVSRRGFIPKGHKNYKAVDLPPLPVYLGISALEVFQLARKQINIYKNSETDWRNVIDSIRTQVPQIWAYLSITERKNFLRHVRPFWEVHRHRIPEESLQILEENIASGKIEILAGRVLDMESRDGSAYVNIRPRGHTNIKVLTVQKVINCTGPQTDFRKIEQPLIQALMQKGWLKTDELNLGLAVNREGQLIREDGNVMKNIFAIGSLRKGAMWECTALREIALQADQLVNKLNSDLISLEV
jgi:uncharacterized NAD(P)/FAD-binding protein YdhS